MEGITGGITKEHIDEEVNYVFNHEKFISAEIQKECDRQDQKWGVRNQHPLAWLAILMEEVGEVTQEVNDAHHEISRMNLENYRTELVQCGAVIQQMIKNIQHYE